MTKKELEAKMRKLKVLEEDLDESFIRSSGPGGQNVNKVATCVYLVHRPTKISVKCQKSRLQGVNRFTARCLLCEEIEGREKKRRQKKIQQKEKLKRQNRKRSRKAKELMLAEKRKRSEIKSGRKKVASHRVDGDL